MPVENSPYFKNTVITIFPYADNGQWMFDDARVGLFREAFVLGADKIIEGLARKAGIKNPRKGVKALFSKSPIPGADVLDWVEAAGPNPRNHGNWYVLRGTDMKGWLCGSLYSFFEEAPKQIYVKIEPKE